MKDELQSLLLAAVRSLEGSALPGPVDPAVVTVERARDAQHGDFASNVAMRLAKAAGTNPRELAARIVAALPASPLVTRADIAGAGFINFTLARDLYAREVARVHELGEAYGRHRPATPCKVLLEFVSANPTGPMHVGHGRQAAFGDALGRLLAAAGDDVTREYYINDAGRQTEILAVSVWLRYLERCGESLPFPSNGYRGDYLLPLGAALQAREGDALRHPAAAVMAGLPADAGAAGGDKEAHIDALIARCRTLIGEQAWQRLLRDSIAAMMDGIRDDLEGFGVRFDHWVSERAFAESGAIDRALGRLRERGLLYMKDGAEWFRATQFGDDEDRVVVRDNGVKTYFASDIAYHLDKRERGYDRLIDVLGADHHGYVTRVRGGLQAFGHPGDCLEAPLIQLVALYRNGEKVSMGKREANFVTLRQLREEVGNDACRIFFLMRSNDQSLDFDLELAKSKSNENPVFYVQYAHARVASVMKELAARGFGWDAARARATVLARGAELLSGPHAEAMLAALSRYPEVVRQAAAQRAPHAMVHYLRELATTLHAFYNAERVLVPEQDLREARVYALLAVQQALRNGLGILGASAPESM
ncbi:MAG: arginine--tRNA ligase [Gammaproteobacteria bacterium]|nr:arginine--tRNA ligase [Gammaproteobacteria bacterium]